MSRIIHEPWIYARTSLHYKLIDALQLLNYLYGMDTKKEIGRRINYARKAKKLKLRDVCNQIPGLTPSRLSNWCQGIRTPDIDEIKKLAPVLEVSAAYLLTLEDEPTIDPELKEFLNLPSEIRSWLVKKGVSGSNGPKRNHG